MEVALLIAQTVVTGALAAWLTLGVRDNLLHPSINETYTAEVLEMTRMREEYPEAFAQVAHRAVKDRRLQMLAFKTVVGAELAASLLLWIATACLALAVFGILSADSARAAGILGATAFTSIWAGFLVIGNHFSYWFSHEGTQNTHFQMTLWGLGTIILNAQS